MKKAWMKWAAAAVAVVLVLALLPTFLTRVRNEEKNKSVVVSLLYNDIRMKLSKAALDRELDRYKEIGIRTVTVTEEDLNSLIASGSVTCLKYNVLCHKYEDENEQIIARLRELPDITNDSYVLISKRPENVELLDRWIPLKMLEGTDYTRLDNVEGATIYVLYDGAPATWQISVGFDERELAYLTEKGFKIAMAMQVKNYRNAAYLDEVDALIKKYDVELLNIKDDYRHPNKETVAKANYDGITRLIQDNDMTLVVTENADQLSNQKPIGYQEIFRACSDRVIRSYETYDIIKGDPTEYSFRYQQYLNSTIDRNIRMITVTQLTNATGTLMEQNRLTQRAVEEYINKIQELGFDTENLTLDFDYTVNKRLTSAIAMLIMILTALAILELLAGRGYRWIRIVALIGAVGSVPFAFVAPEAILNLYPTLWAVLAPCFAITLMLRFVREHKGMKLLPLFLSTTGVLLAVLAVGGFVQASLLSGMEYYINFTIFRGIKLSLFAPIAYSAVAYYMIFLKQDNRQILVDCRRAANAKISVYWLLVLVAVGGVGFIYLMRSGNVSEISALETKMRTVITEAFAARPRTKEFLVGYPCLVLFLYYLKNSRSHLLPFLFSVGSSILAASVINSFCHVFTDVLTIYSRVLNGLLLGLFTALIAYLLNLVVAAIMKKTTELEAKYESEV